MNMQDNIAEVDRDGSIFKEIRIQNMFCDLLCRENYYCPLKNYLSHKMEKLITAPQSA